LYTGYCSSLAEREKTHNEGKGAKYTRNRTPVKIVYSEKLKTKSRAMKREFEIKRLTRKEKHLNIRAFSPNQKREAYERQKGICVECKEHFEIEGMEADHITPWHEGGKTNAENCQMLCKEDNRRKSGK